METLRLRRDPLERWEEGQGVRGTCPARLFLRFPCWGAQHCLWTSAGSHRWQCRPPSPVTQGQFGLFSLVSFLCSPRPCTAVAATQVCCCAMGGGNQPGSCPGPGVQSISREEGEEEEPGTASIQALPVWALLWLLSTCPSLRWRGGTP